MCPRFWNIRLYGNTWWFPTNCPFLEKNSSQQSEPLLFKKDTSFGKLSLLKQIKITIKCVEISKSVYVSLERKFLDSNRSVCLYMEFLHIPRKWVTNPAHSFLFVSDKDGLKIHQHTHVLDR